MTFPKSCLLIDKRNSLKATLLLQGMGLFAKDIRLQLLRSRRFVYKTTRNLMGVVGDTGAWLRTTMGALVLCGVPEEKYWPYTTNDESGSDGKPTFDDEPTSFVYAIADDYETVRYFCHDPIGKSVDPANVLAVRSDI